MNLLARANRFHRKASWFRLGLYSAPMGYFAWVEGFRTQTWTTKHPILLPKDHPVTKAIIVYYHEKYLHGGSQALLAALRQRYWPIGGRKFVASVINQSFNVSECSLLLGSTSWVACQQIECSPIQLFVPQEWTIVGHSIIRQRPEIKHPARAISPSLSAFPRRLIIWKWSRISRRILSSQR